MCVAANEAGETRAQFLLVVHSRPRITLLAGDRNRTVVLGAAVVLACPAEGTPSPTVRWLRAGEPIREQQGANDEVKNVN
jgi:hypothetical protein